MFVLDNNAIGISLPEKVNLILPVMSRRQESSSAKIKMLFLNLAHRLTKVSLNASIASVPKKHSIGDY